MKAGLHCVWCGTQLEYEDGHAICLDCGTIFTNTSFQRTTSEGEESIAVEMNITIECISFEPKIENPSFFKVPQKPEPAPALIYG